MDQLTNFVVALWLVISFAMIGLRGGGFPYYLLSAIPPLALVAAIELNTSYQHWKLSSLKQANLGRSTIIALVIGFFLSSNFSLYHDYTFYKFDRLSKDDFLRSVGDEEFASWQISNYVKTHTEPNDLIYLWGNRVELYYYTDRLPPVDILWPAYIEATGSPSRIFDSRTKYIIVDKPGKMDYPQWLIKGLAAHYELETIIEERRIYRRMQ